MIYKNCLLMNHNDSAGYNFCYLDDEVFGEMNREAVRLDVGKNPRGMLYDFCL